MRFHARVYGILCTCVYELSQSVRWRWQPPGHSVKGWFDRKLMIKVRKDPGDYYAGRSPCHRFRRPGENATLGVCHGHDCRYQTLIGETFAVAFEFYGKSFAFCQIFFKSAETSIFLICYQFVPFEIPSAPMFINCLGEIRSYKFGTSFQPILRLLSDNQTLHHSVTVLAWIIKHEIF